MSRASRSVIGRIRERLRHGVLLQEFLNRLSRAGVGIHPYVVFEESIDTRSASAEAPHGIDCRRIEAADLGSVGNVDGRPVPAERLQQRLRDGQIAIGAFVSDECVAYTWADLSSFHGLGHAVTRRPLAADEAYLYDAYTTPAMRGRAIVPVLRARLYDELHRVGRRRLLSVSQAFNRSARRFKQKLGARELETRLYLCLGKRYHRDLALRRHE